MLRYWVYGHQASHFQRVDHRCDMTLLWLEIAVIPRESPVPRNERIALGGKT